MQQIIFQRELLIEAPLTHVWQLVATEEGLRQWWGNAIFLEAKVGGRCEEWRGNGQRSTCWQGFVTTYAPPHHLVLTLHTQEPSVDEPELTTISIALEAKGQQTSVNVTQRAFAPMAAIGTTLPQTKEPHPTGPQNVPLAQLTRPVPGAYPLPDSNQIPNSGRIEPSYYLLTQQQSESLTATWHGRLETLATTASAPPTIR